MAVASAGPYASLHLAPDRQYYTTQSFFTGRMPFLPPNQQRQSTEGKFNHRCKKRFYVFYFPNVFIFKKRWQSSEREADKQEALSK